MPGIKKDSRCLLFGSNEGNDEGNFLTGRIGYRSHRPEVPMMRRHSLVHGSLERLVGMMIRGIGHVEEGWPRIGTQKIGAMANRALR